MFDASSQTKYEYRVNKHLDRDSLKRRPQFQIGFEADKGKGWISSWRRIWFSLGAKIITRCHVPSLRVFSRRVIEQSRKSRSNFLSRYSCRKEKQKRRKNFSSSSHNLVENLETWSTDSAVEYNKHASIRSFFVRTTLLVFFIEFSREPRAHPSRCFFFVAFRTNAIAKNIISDPNQSRRRPLWNNESNQRSLIFFVRFEEKQRGKERFVRFPEELHRKEGNWCQNRQKFVEAELSRQSFRLSVSGLTALLLLLRPPLSIRKVANTTQRYPPVAPLAIRF